MSNLGSKTPYGSTNHPYAKKSRNAYNHAANACAETIISQVKKESPFSKKVEGSSWTYQGKNYLPAPKYNSKKNNNKKDKYQIS